MTSFKKLLAYVKKYPLEHTVGITLTALGLGLNLYRPLLIGEVIDYFTSQSEQGVPVSLTWVGKKLGLYFLIILSGIVITFVGSYILGRASNALGRDLRNDVFKQVQRLPISYFDDKPAGKISSRIVNDTEVIRQSVYHNFNREILIQILLLLGIYGAIYWVQPQIALYLLGLLPIFALWQYIYNRLIKPHTNEWRESISQMNSQLAELIQGADIVQLFQAEEMIEDEFEETNQRWYTSRNRMTNINAFFSWNISGLLSRLVTLALLVYFGGTYLEGSLALSLGSMYVLLDYISRLFDPIGQIVRLLVMLQQGQVAGERVLELRDEPAEEDSTKQLEVPHGEVVFENVSFGYKPGTPVLRHINLKAHEGETLGIVGPTGSGKSSLINLLFRFYDPQEGRILIDGQDTRNYERESVRAQMGIVLQDPFLFSGTIASNITMGNDAIGEEEVKVALKKVGAWPMIERFKDGIYHPVEEKGRTFSSGERQLLSFARTLAANPKILILDEATSHIDSESESLIQEAMRVVQKGRTTLIIAHRLSTIRDADKIILLQHGVISEEGTHEELLQLGGTYAEMYRLQEEIL